MEKDLELGKEAEENDENGVYEYSDYIEVAFTALSAIQEVNALTETEKKRVDNIRKKAVYLISGAIDRLVIMYDEEHEEHD